MGLRGELLLEVDELELQCGRRFLPAGGRECRNQLGEPAMQERELCVLQQDRLPQPLNPASVVTSSQNEGLCTTDSAS